MGKLIPWRIICVLILTAASSGQITVKFFGMAMNHRDDHDWPDLRFGTFRLWDSQTTWADLNPGPGSYKWNTLDSRLKDAQDHGLDVLYTFGRTPRWISDRPNDQTNCSPQPGECGAPKDLNPDGSGSDQAWKDFVTAIAKHANGRITAWELWNEPYNQDMWKGTVPQLIRMIQDASTIIKGIDPDALILSPSTGIKIERGKAYLRQLLSAGEGQYVGGMAFHGYMPYPEAIVPLLDEYKQTVQQFGQSSKPIWNTEGAWAPGSEPADPPADVARLYILQAADGVARFMWYAYDNRKWGNMWTPETGKRPQANAYEKIQDWLIGATFDGPCQVKDDVWVCDLHKNGGAYKARIAWFAKSGSTTNYKVPAQYVTAQDLTGNTSQVSGSVTLSSRPVLLEQAH
jgi:hypothetical protein